MKYKVGDKVRIKSIDWYNENKSKSHGTVVCGGKYFELGMKAWCGEIMTILEVDYTCYIMNEDGGRYLWTDEMIEGLIAKNCPVEQLAELWSKGDKEMQGKYEKTKQMLGNWEHEFPCPDGYEFHDENGNVIEAKKIILEKKKPKYPKSYEECCEILDFKPIHGLALQLVVSSGFSVRDTQICTYERNLTIKLEYFRKLLICRDAYWKIAGEEMGLGKSSEPDFRGVKTSYVITVESNKILKSWTTKKQVILAFPTEEMRDTFYENFKELIEECKELL